MSWADPQQIPRLVPNVFILCAPGEEIRSLELFAWTLETSLGDQKVCSVHAWAGRCIVLQDQSMWLCFYCSKWLETRYKYSLQK